MLDVSDTALGKVFCKTTPDEFRDWMKNKDKRMLDKVTTVKEAVDKYIKDGAYVVFGGFSLVRIPMAVTHEIMRQGLRLATSGNARTLDFDFFLDCDCLSQVDIGYVLGLEVFGIPRYSRLKFQEGIKDGSIEVTEWTNAAMAWRHKAGEMGVPFLAVRNMMGTETFKRSAAKLSKCPFTGSSIVLLPALFPDVSVVHVQRSDIYGNAQIDGMTNVDISAIKSSKRVILTTEEIIPHEKIRDHPEQTQIPYFYVDAVIPIPYGGHPSNCPKYYYADVKYIRDYVDASSDPTGK